MNYAMTISNSENGVVSSLLMANSKLELMSQVGHPTVRNVMDQVLGDRPGRYELLTLGEAVYTGFILEGARDD